MCIGGLAYSLFVLSSLQPFDSVSVLFFLIPCVLRSAVSMRGTLLLPRNSTRVRGNNRHGYTNRAPKASWIACFRESLHPRMNLVMGLRG